MDSIKDLSVDKEVKEFWDKLLTSNEKELEELKKDKRFIEFKYAFVVFCLKCRQLKHSDQVKSDK